MSKDFLSSMNRKNNKLTAIVPVLVLCLLTFFLYFESLHHGFTNWDDTTHLLKNLTIKSLSKTSIVKIFTEPVDYVYVPLTMLSYAVEYHFFGYNPRSFHLTNLLLHLAVTVLVYYFAVGMGLTTLGAFMAALIFGIHPMHVESVAWVTGRKDVLYGSFFMVALIFYNQYLEKRESKYYIFCLTAGFLSILAKPMALSLPFVMGLLDWWKRRPITKTVLVEKLIPFVYIIPVIWLTYRYHTRLPGQNVTEAPLVWVWTFIFYVKKFFLPFEFIPLYELPKPIGLNFAEYQLAFFILFIIIFLLKRYPKNRWGLFSFLFYFVCIFYLLRFDDLKDESIVADRFMYVPSAGFCILCGWFLGKINSEGKRFKLKRIIAAACTIIIFLFLFSNTFNQIKVWKDSLSLWDYVIKKNPNLSSPYLNKGDALNALKRYDEAIPLFNKAIEINPSLWLAFNDRGTAYGMKGNFDQAIENFKRALQLKPDDIDTILNLSEAYRLKGQYQTALDYLDSAIKMKPDYPGTYLTRALIYYSQQNWGPALTNALKAKGMGYPVDQQFIKLLKNESKIP